SQRKPYFLGGETNIVESAIYRLPAHTDSEGRIDEKDENGCMSTMQRARVLGGNWIPEKRLDHVPSHGAAISQAHANNTFTTNASQRPHRHLVGTITLRGHFGKVLSCLVGKCLANRVLLKSDAGNEPPKEEKWPPVGTITLRGHFGKVLSCLVGKCLANRVLLKSDAGNEPPKEEKLSEFLVPNRALNAFWTLHDGRFFFLHVRTICPASGGDLSQPNPKFRQEPTKIHDQSELLFNYPPTMVAMREDPDIAIQSY
ncbi:hypothetical protein DFH07DRAFT_984413, partial [Mycena maculata]